MTTTPVGLGRGRVRLRGQHYAHSPVWVYDGNADGSAIGAYIQRRNSLTHSDQIDDNGSGNSGKVVTLCATATPAVLHRALGNWFDVCQHR